MRSLADDCAHHYFQAGGVDLSTPLILDDSFGSPESTVLHCGPPVEEDDGSLLVGADFALLSMGDGKSSHDDLPG